MAKNHEKGKIGERDIALKMELYFRKVAKEMNVGLSINPYFTRNLDQTALGGSDIANPLNLQIEIKNRDNLQVNSWWNQVVKSTEQFGGEPILIYKVKYVGWRCVMMLQHPRGWVKGGVRAELSEDEFFKVFEGICSSYFRTNEKIANFSHLD